MKIVILCPQGSRTGGPEALHQLSDALISLGHDAKLWYYNDGELPHIVAAISNGERMFFNATSCAIDEYKSYRIDPYTSYEPGEDAVFVLPETLLHYAPFFQRHRVVVWWLSLDFAMSALGQINLNFLRAGFVSHVTQSFYAHTVTKALGFTPAMMTDYTIIPKLPILELDERPRKVCVNANHKVIVSLDYLEDAIKSLVPDVEVVRVSGMAREQIYKLFAESRLYIDLGAFAGNDRMPREAAALGALVVISGTGSGADDRDYPQSEVYRPNPFDLNHIAKLSAEMVLNPSKYISDFNSLRVKVSTENERFHSEVASVFASFR